MASVQDRMNAARKKRESKSTQEQIEEIVKDPVDTTEETAAEQTALTEESTSEQVEEANVEDTANTQVEEANAETNVEANVEDLTDEIENALKNADSLDGENPPLEATTQTFTATNNKSKKDDTPEKEEKRKEKEKNSGIRSNAVLKLEAERNRLSSNVVQLLTMRSNTSRICGYICKEDSKIDFGVRTEQDKNNSKQRLTNIVLRNSPPSAPAGVIISDIADYVDLIGYKQQHDNDKITARAVEEAKNCTTRIISIVQRADLPTIITSRYAGYIIESDEIFVPVVTKTRKIKALGDFRSNSPYIPSQSCLYIHTPLTENKDTNGNTVNAATRSRIKHSFRSRLVAPGNYIALRRPKTVHLKKSYTPVEAESMIDLYLSKYCKHNKENTSVIDKLTTANSNLFVLKHPGKNSTGETIISETSYFPTNESNSWSKSEKVYHWHDKNEDGTPKAISPNNINLVLKVKETSSKGTTSVRVQYDRLSDVNSAGNYKFDPKGVHSKIFKATEEKLTYDDIISFTPTRKVSKTNAPKAAVGMQLEGISLDSIDDIVSSVWQQG